MESNDKMIIKHCIETQYSDELTIQNGLVREMLDEEDYEQVVFSAQKAIDLGKQSDRLCKLVDAQPTAPSINVDVTKAEGEMVVKYADKPCEEVRAHLKEQGFKWKGKELVWHRKGSK